MGVASEAESHDDPRTLSRSVARGLKVTGGVSPLLKTEPKIATRTPSLLADGKSPQSVLEGAFYATESPVPVKPFNGNFSVALRISTLRQRVTVSDESVPADAPSSRRAI